MSTLGFLLKDAAERLEKAGASDPGIDSELLMMSASGGSRSYLFLHRNDPVDPVIEERFESMLKKRISGIPVQYILGSQEFMGMDFIVTKDVLIPRMDTEILVEWVIERAREMEPELSIMDMCCGSGAIAVSTAGLLPDIHMTACDISEAAIEIAGKNAEANNTISRTVFVRSDMFHILDGRESFPGEPFDMILCNPPYIPSSVIPGLQREVREHEPLLALDGGPDGLDFYRVIAEEASYHLKTGGLLFLEIGHDQAEAVKEILESAGGFNNIEIRRDLAGNERVVCCTTF